jgi:branched-chain amino acid transport system permease protein
MDYIYGMIALIGINLLVVLGLSLLTGFTGIFSFGHAGFMAIGAYLTVWFSMTMGLNFYLALALAGLLTGLISLVIGKITLNLKGDYFIIATMGFGESIRLILDNLQTFGGARGWSEIPSYTNATNVWIIDLIGLVILVNIIRSRHGRNFKAIREEELASQIIGINVFKYKMISLMISAIYAGVGGGLFAHYMSFIQPKMFQMIKSTELTIMVIFGGMGSISGSVLGTVILTGLPQVLLSLDAWRYVIYGAAVIFIMIARPQGMMGGFELTPAQIKAWWGKRTQDKQTKKGAM